MLKLFLTSGDLIADRRAAYADMLLEAGDAAAAADLMRETVTLVPSWTGGWFRLGEMCEAAGRLAEAADAWREALRLDPRDRLGAALKLELAGVLPVGASLSGGFAEVLFDRYAEEFDAALVGRLGYRAPAMIADAIAAVGAARFARLVDLGCGTGLMGERLRSCASFIEGVDISSGMLAKARAKGIYDRLVRAEVLSLAPEGADRADLVTAADLLNYLGRLEPVVATVAGLLAPGGLFAFSVELHDGDEDLVLAPSRRYRHSEGHVVRTLAEGGFDLLRLEHVTLRMDRGEPVRGLVVVAGLTLPRREFAGSATTADDGTGEGFAYER